MCLAEASNILRFLLFPMFEFFHIYKRVISLLLSYHLRFTPFYDYLMIVFIRITGDSHNTHNGDTNKASDKETDEKA